MTTVLMIIILVLLAKHFKMKALVSMLAIQTVPLPVEVVNLTAAMMSAMIAPDPAIGTKVVCAYPVAVICQNILGYLVYAIAQYFRPVTWCKGYKYNKKCALYIFVYVTVTVALRHKIMTRRIAQQLGEVQYIHVETRTKLA